MVLDESSLYHEELVGDFVDADDPTKEALLGTAETAARFSQQ